MLDRLKDLFRDSRGRERITIALSRGAAMRTARTVDLTPPETWEFSGFSQNGEDGLLAQSTEVQQPLLRGDWCGRRDRKQHRLAPGCRTILRRHGRGEPVPGGPSQTQRRSPQHRRRGRADVRDQAQCRGQLLVRC